MDEARDLPVNLLVSQEAEIEQLKADVAMLKSVIMALLSEDGFISAQKKVTAEWNKVRLLAARELTKQTYE